MIRFVVKKDAAVSEPLRCTKPPQMLNESFREIRRSFIPKFLHRSHQPSL